MEINKRLRRVALLCCHFARNLAYYRAGFDGRKFNSQDEFWTTVNGNFLDICVLEWCKLFGNHSDKHHWKQIVDDKENFKLSMFCKISISKAEFDKCWKSIRTYRDDFVAHLDSDEVMNIPKLDIAWSAVKYYHSYLIKLCANSNVLHGIPTNLEHYYQKCYSMAEAAYGK